jgi:hypothetical protein
MKSEVAPTFNILPYLVLLAAHTRQQLQSLTFVPFEPISLFRRYGGTLVSRTPKQAFVINSIHIC